MARTAGKPPKWAWMNAWMKPVAWAATLGLSLAIVLQLAQPPGEPLELGTLSAADSLREEIKTKDSHVVEEAEAAARMRAGSNQVEKRQDADFAAADTPSPALVDDSTAGENVARKQSLEIEQPAAAKSEASRFASAAAESVDGVSSLSREIPLEPTCPLAQRQDADDWSDCILALRKQGQEQLAEAEVEFFKAAFPNFPANK